MPPKKKLDKEKTAGKAKSEAVNSSLPLTPADVLINEGIVTTFALSSKKAHRNVRDINVSNLTVTFHGTALIEEAELSLNYGNRYGYIGNYVMLYPEIPLTDWIYES